MAGLFEGEGHIALRRGQHVTATVKMNDEDVIRRLFEVAQCGRIHGPYVGRAGYPPYWEWTVGRAPEVRAFLAAIEPWMGARRKSRIVEATRHIASNRGARADLTHCPQGHAYELRYKSGTARICRECHRIRERRRYADRKTAKAV